MKFEVGDRVTVYFGETEDITGIQDATVMKFFSWFTKTQNDGNEYYGVMPDVLSDDPEASPLMVSDDKMKKITT